MHPINTYGTALEAQQLAIIANLFPHHEVINPNEPVHQQACQDMKRILGNGMPYFIHLAGQCSMGVALPFRDGKLGAGVFAEACRIAHGDRLVWLLSHEGKLSRFDPTDTSRVLTVEETRARVRNPDGSTRPY